MEAEQGRKMTGTGAMEGATRRLSAALDAMEAAIERRKDADRAELALAAQLHASGTDRSRLAGTIDDLTARNRHLAQANRDASQRVSAAIESIRGVLDAQTE